MGHKNKTTTLVMAQHVLKVYTVSQNQTNIKLILNLFFLFRKKVLRNHSFPKWCGNEEHSLLQNVG